MEFLNFICGTECDYRTSFSQTTGVAPIETIISARKVYGDTLHNLKHIARTENFNVMYVSIAF